jgi:hypothetical protein
VNTSQLKHYRKLHQLDVKENRKGERSKMDNPNTQATLGTRHRTKKNSTYNTTQQIKMMINTDPMQKPGGAPTCFRRVSTNICFLLDGPQDHDNIYIVFIAAMTST